MAPSNQAAYLLSDRSNPLTVQDAPYPSLGPNDLVVKTRAIALSVADSAIQRVGSNNPGFAHLPYPYVLGSDVAGEVYEVGSNVTRFKVGDRIVAQGTSFFSKETARGTFQKYVLLSEINTTLLPDHVSFEEASVLPLAITTASSGMFTEDFLNLQFPSVNSTPTGKVLVIWGGSTSVGAAAIQLAVNAGYEVVSTCSPRNFEAILKLGASLVLDYNSDTVVTDIIDALKNKEIAGCMALSNHWKAAKHDAVEACAEIALKSKGNKFVASGGPPTKQAPEGVTTKFIWPSGFTEKHWKAIYGDFLGPALAQKKFVPAPPPLVFGKGLESLQGALDRVNEGISYQKVVVSID